MATRAWKLMANVEEPLHEGVETASKQDATSISEYIRNLIIRDLLIRGLLTEKTKLGLIIG